MNKREVCEYLGKSKRSVETYISSGRLTAKYFNGPNGKTTVFDRADVAAFKDRMSETYDPVIKDPAGALALVKAQPVAVAPPARVFEPLPPAAHQPPAAPTPRVKPWLTLEEAEAFSGLTARWLLTQAESAKPLVTVRDMGRHTRGGRWRFFRGDLVKG